MVVRFSLYQALRATWYSLRQWRHVTFSMCVASPVVPSDFHGSFGSYLYVPALYASVLAVLRGHVLHPQWWTIVPAGAVSACLAMFLSVNRCRAIALSLVVVSFPSSPPCYRRGMGVNARLRLSVAIKAESCVHFSCFDCHGCFAWFFAFVNLDATVLGVSESLINPRFVLSVVDCYRGWFYVVTFEDSCGHFRFLVVVLVPSSYFCFECERAVNQNKNDVL